VPDLVPGDGQEMEVAIPVEGGTLHGEVVAAGDVVVLLHAGRVDSRVRDREPINLALLTEIAGRPATWHFVGRFLPAPQVVMSLTGK
jgi:hypothetical protein